MIKRLDEIAQREFDERVRKAKRSNSLKTNIFGRKINCPTRNNFTNVLSIIPYHDSTMAVVKSASLSSRIRYWGTVNLFQYAGLVGYQDASNLTRIQQEKSKLELLYSKGCNVPELIHTAVDGVVITEYLEGKAFDSLDGKGKVEALEKGTKSLQQIHQHCLHGDPSVQNMVILNKGVYWVDPEFILDPSVPYIDLLAQELVLFIKSAAKHTGMAQPTVEIICESYDNPEVLERVLRHNKVKNCLYRWIVHQVSYELAAQTKQAVDEQIGKMLKRAWGDSNSRSFP